MKYWIEVKTNYKDSRIIWLFHKIFRYYPAKKVSSSGGYDEKFAYAKWEYDIKKDYKHQKEEHPLIYELRDDLYCLCQMHGQELIASIIGRLRKSTYSDHKKACKRMSKTISDYIDGKIHIIADQSLSIKELRKIFDL